MQPLARNPFHVGPINKPLRYALITVVGLLIVLLFVAMIYRRDDLEPVVRAIDLLLSQRRRRKGYDPDVYNIYVAGVGAMGILALAAVAHGLATQARTVKSIDRYLAGRLPRHEQTLKPDDQ